MVRSIVQETETAHTPESLAESLAGEPGLVLLLSALPESRQARHSFLAVRPFLVFRSFGTRCELIREEAAQRVFGNPWQVLNQLMGRYELLDEADLPFPLGGCFGFWGYDLNHFVEPRLARRSLNDLDLPDCQLGFYDSLVAFDHWLGKAWIISTGLSADGARCRRRARRQVEWWQERLSRSDLSPAWQCREVILAMPGRVELLRPPHREESATDENGFGGVVWRGARVVSSLSRRQYLRAVEQAQTYIRAGDIYQVNLAHRLSARTGLSGWEWFTRLQAVSPAPFAAFMDAGGFQLGSSSPELFLRMSGRQIRTRPIKGTRPRSPDQRRDTQLAVELQTSPKETAELVMITDLLRNDLGRVCEFGSVTVPELARLERYAQVQHLVSTVEGRLRPEVTHLEALSACFPGGSVTGAPKVRALEIIEELEPVRRGPYTGCLGYLGFNQESQLSILIRTAVCQPDRVHFHAGAGIVADSDPAAEYAETLAKAGGFFQALRQRRRARACLA
jgi:para-aminobenzoate synthetase component 1